MRIILDEPFRSLWRKGYLRQSKTDNRRRIDLVNDKNDRTTISYARYLVCVSRGKLLPDGYEVDHIDKDCCNDALDNLQVLSVDEHKKKTRKECSIGRAVVELVCPNCNALFKREKRNIKKNTIPKCSRKCNAEFNRKNNVWTGRKKIDEKVAGSNPARGA